eukprot:gene3907-7120_t
MSSFSVKDILSGLKSKDLKQQIVALSSLSSVEKKLIKQIPKDVIKLMVDLLANSEKKPLTVSCLTSFAHLSTFDALKLTIGQQGGIAAILPHTYSNDSTVQKQAVRTLHELSTNDKNHNWMIPGFVHLIGLLQREEKELYKLTKEIFLRVIESENKLPEDFFDDDIILSLFVMFDSPLQEKQFCALDFISKIINKNEKDALLLCEYGLLEHLIILMKSNNLETVTLSIQILKNISKLSTNIKKWTGEFESIPIFFELLKGAKGNFNEIILEILYNISREEKEYEESINEKGDKTKKLIFKNELYDNKKEIHEHGTSVLLKFLDASKNDKKMVKYSIDIIGNIAVEEITKKLITKELTNLLIILLTSSTVTLEIRKSVHETMASFAKDEACVKELVACEVMNKLLKMLKEKRESLLAMELFASLNQHPSFQREIFESFGLEEIKSFLKSEIEEERDSGLKALIPFSSTPNGRMQLLQLNIMPILKEMYQDENENLIIKANAKTLYKKLKKDQSLYALNPTNNNGTYNPKEFKFDFDEIHRIDKELVETVQTEVSKKLGVKKLRMQVNWRQIERISNIEEKQDAIYMLGKEEIWEEFQTAIDLFTFDEETVHSFNTNIKYITIEVDHLKEDEKCIEIDELQMKYTIPIDGALFSPKQIAAMISIHLLDRDVTEEIEEIDEKYQIAVEELKKVCKDSRIPMLGDINILYFHLLLSDKLYKESFKENQAIAVCKKEVLDSNEMFLKGWKIVKLNSKGLKQERLLILTNWNYYTICYDYKKKKIDYSHTKMHPLEEIDSIDIGLLKPKNVSKDDVVSVDERIYSFNIWTNDDAKHQETNIKFDDDDFKDKKKLQGGVIGGAAQSFIGSFYKKVGTPTMSSTTSPPDSPTDEPIEIVTDSKIDEVDEDSDTLSMGDDLLTINEDDKERDNDGLRSNIFVAPGEAIRSKQKMLTEEISWCVWTAACSFKRAQLHEPFYKNVEKPEGSILSSIYNSLSIGSSKTDTKTKQPLKDGKSSQKNQNKK